MNGRHTRIARRLVWLGVAAALAAPAAAAGGETRGSAFEGSHDRSDATLRNDVAHFGAPSSSRADSGANLRNDQAHDGTDRSPSTPAAVVVRVDGGFDWASAGVGAAGGLGLVLVAAAGASALRRRNGVDAAQA
jgi:hypothetical protein